MTLHRVSLAALPWGVCPRCHRQPVMRWGTPRQPPPFLAGATIVGSTHTNWTTCPDCKLCALVGSGLLTPPDDLDLAQELIDLSAYAEVEFVIDIGPPYQEPGDLRLAELAGP